MNIESRKALLSDVGWRFEVHQPDPAWQIVARQGERVVVVRSPDQAAAWRAILSAIEDQRADGRYRWS